MLIQNRALLVLEEKQGKAKLHCQEGRRLGRDKKPAGILDLALRMRQKIISTGEVTQALKKFSLWGSSSQEPPETEAQTGKLQNPFCLHHKSCTK